MKVSVCIPTYRQIEYLRETLRSLYVQDFTDYEVIVSDDSPDDSVRDLLYEFSFVNRIQYVRNKQPLGSPENWNAAIRLARGEYIKILHHDDQLIGTSSLKRFMQLLDDNPESDFGFSATLVNHIDTGLQRVHCATDKQLADLAADPSSLFVGNCIGAPSVTIFRRSAALEYDQRMKWLVDIDHYYRILMLNRQFAFTNEVLIKTPTSATHQVTEVCRNNGEIELAEAMMMFEKFSQQQRQNPLVKQGWMIFFRRFKMRKLTDFARFGLPVPQECGTDGYFTTLLRQPYTIWHLLLDPTLLARKIFYRLYPSVPSPIRSVLKTLHSFLASRKN